MKMNQSFISRALMITIMILCFHGTSAPVQTFGDTGTKEKHPGNYDTISLFRVEYSQILQRGEKGALSADIFNEAKELHLFFEKYLIESEGRLQTIKLEIREFSGNRQEEAVNRLQIESGKREHDLSDFLSRIRHLTASGREEPSVSRTIEEPSDPERKALESSRDREYKSGHGLEIDIRPQDLTSDKEEIW